MKIAPATLTRQHIAGLSAFVLASCLVSPALAAKLNLSPASVTLDPITASQDESGPDLAERVADAPKPFGARGTSWITVGASIGHDFSDATDSSVYGSFAYFVADDVEVTGELGAWYFSQEGDNAIGIAPMLIFRWHFINRQSWTLFADAGIGLLFSTDDVPSDGTSFNFSPRFGIGFTQRLTEADSGPRLVAGLRWQHFSNARIDGDTNNPGRDDLTLYGGVMWQFR
jgi:hypothetical protein